MNTNMAVFFMVFKNRCFFVCWTKVASALKGLNSQFDFIEDSPLPILEEFSSPQFDDNKPHWCPVENKVN